MAFKERITGLLGKRPLESDAVDTAPAVLDLRTTEASSPQEIAPAGDDDVSSLPAASGGLRDRVIEVLKTVYDPEIPVDIYELGLIYEVDIRKDQDVYIQMTLTTPMCPVAETLPPEVENKVRSVAGIENVELELVWDPPWNPEMMSEAAKLTLNF